MDPNKEALANLQEAFRGSLDPEVVDLILAESNYVDDALEKLLTISRTGSSDLSPNSENSPTKQDCVVNTACNRPPTNNSTTFRGNKIGHKTFSLRDDKRDYSLAPLANKEDICDSVEVTEGKIAFDSSEVPNSTEAMGVKDNSQSTNSTKSFCGGQSGIEVTDQALLPNQLPPWPDINPRYMHQMQTFPGQPHVYQALPAFNNFQVQRFTGDARYFHYMSPYQFQRNMGTFHPRNSFCNSGLRYPPVGLHPRKGTPPIGAHFKKNKFQAHFGMQQHKETKKSPERKERQTSNHPTLPEGPFLPLSEVLVILRGLPGSGKTTLAQKLKGDGVILSTDDFFIRNGKYQYEQIDLPKAHEWNQKRARECMQRGVSPVIIDNTNTQAWEMRPYAAMARRFGYEVIIKEPETPWKWNTKELLKRNQHNVTLSGIQSMKERYEKDLTVEAILGNNCQVVPKTEIWHSSNAKNDKDVRNIELSVQSPFGIQRTKPVTTSTASPNPCSISQPSDQGFIYSKAKFQDARPEMESLRSHGSRSPIQDVDYSIPEALQDPQSLQRNENLNKVGPAEVDFDETILPKPQRTPKKRERASKLVEMEQNTQEGNGNAEKVLDSKDEKTNCCETIQISPTISENVKEDKEGGTVQEIVDKKTLHSSNEIPFEAGQEEQKINIPDEEVAGSNALKHTSVISHKEDTENTFLLINDESKTEVTNSKELGSESCLAKETRKNTNDKDSPTNDYVEPLKDTQSASGFHNRAENIETEMEQSLKNFQNDLSESELSGFQFLNTCFPDMDIQILFDVLAQTQGDVTKSVESILGHDDNSSRVESRKQQDTAPDLQKSSSEIKSAFVAPDPDLRLHSSSWGQESRASLQGSNRTFQMTLEPAVAIQLVELFGPIGDVSLEGDFSSDDLLVKVDSEFAKLLYNQWRGTIQNNSKEKVFYREKQPPVVRTKKKQHSDHIFKEISQKHSLEHRKTADLRQIMSEQMAVEQSRQKQEPSTESMAVVLKRQKLYAMFPGVDPLALEELFEANRYELHSTVSMVETSCNLQAKLSEFQVKPSKEQARSYDDTLGEVKTEFQALQDPDYEDFRAEANTHYKLRDESFRKAAFAFSKNQGQLAQFYASQGHMHTEKIRQANRRAAAKILEHKNSSMDQHSLDLHGLHVDEALSALEDKLLSSESRYLSVITGQGLHSKQGKAKIKPAVLEYLQRNNYRFEELQPGLLRVSLNR